ncbi:hypothetical protein MMC28_010211, partial [Mycoblastus sanguinarius]|nr:hypothetical protein [Mycoblastus sanguinarius]
MSDDNMLLRRRKDIEKLQGPNNYISWASEMKDFFRLAKSWPYIDGTANKAASTDVA